MISICKQLFFMIFVLCNNAYVRY